MQKKSFFLVKKWKNTGSVQLCLYLYIVYSFQETNVATSAELGTCGFLKWKIPFLSFSISNFLLPEADRFNIPRTKEGHFQSWPLSGRATCFLCIENNLFNPKVPQVPSSGTYKWPTLTLNVVTIEGLIHFR